MNENHSTIGMVRGSDPDTSQTAADLVVKSLTKLQQRVYDAFDGRQLSGRQCEQLEEFKECSPSTVRKRVCELARSGMLIECGKESVSGRVPCLVYKQKPQPPSEPKL